MRAVNEMKPNEIKDSKVLIGIEIGNAKKMLGYWWVCSSSYVNAYNGEGIHIFDRIGSGKLEIYTKNNIITEIR